MLKLLLNFPSSSFHGKSFILLIPLKEMNRLRHSSEDCACSTTFPKQKIVSKAWPGKTFLSPLSGFQLSNPFVYSYMMTVEKTSASIQKTVELVEVQHPRYKQVKKALVEHFPVPSDDSSTFWGIAAMICLMASDAWEIYKLIKIISHPRSDCSIMVCSKCFKCSSYFN